MATSRKIQGSNVAFPGCCGATILHGLSTTAAEGSRHANMSESAQFAITSPTQTDEVAALRNAKFVPLATWTNKNSDRELTLWGRGVTKT